MSCVTCGRSVNPITIHRSVVNPVAKRLLTAPTFPLLGMGILSLFFVGFFQALTSYAGAGAAGGAAFVLRHGLFWAFIFFIIRSTADGAQRMGVFGFNNIQDDLITPALKGILSTYLLWIPAAIYIYLAADEGLWGIFTYPAAQDPVVWVLGFFGVVYAPMALLGGATDLSVAALLNPVYLIHTMIRMGKDYLITVVAIGLASLAGVVIQLVGALIVSTLPLPFVPRWIAATLALYAPFVSARMLGLLLYVRGQALDWGKDEDYLEPVLPNAVPRGVFATMSGEERSVEAPKEKAPERKQPIPATPEPIALPDFHGEVAQPRKKPVPPTPEPIALPDFHGEVEPPRKHPGRPITDTPEPLVIPLEQALADLPPPPPGPAPGPAAKPVFGKATRVGYAPATTPSDPAATRLGHGTSIGPTGGPGRDPER